MSANESVAVLLAGRAAVYRVVQNLLGNEPNKETLRQIIDQDTQKVLTLFSQGSDEYQQALRSLFSILEENLKDEPAFLNQLENNFTRLFVGPGKVEADPWESVYLRKDAALFQPSTLEVRKAYVTQGFIPQQYPNVADDHIALELDFMTRVAEEADAAFATDNNIATQKYLNASRDFLTQHLLVWAPSFAKTLREAQHSYFYRNVGNLLEAFLPLDLQALEEILATLD
jgi:TorA maturation chaperone TorD